MASREIVTIGSVVLLSFVCLSGCATTRVQGRECCAAEIFGRESIGQLLDEFSGGDPGFQKFGIYRAECRLFVVVGGSRYRAGAAWLEIEADGEILTRRDDEVRGAAGLARREDRQISFVGDACCASERYSNSYLREELLRALGKSAFEGGLRIYRDDCRLSAELYPPWPYPPDSELGVRVLPDGTIRFNDRY